MEKKEVIVRRILGWKLNSYNKWFDPEKRIFISEFEPDKKIEDAMLIVKRLESFGFTYSQKNDSVVCFNDICAVGKTTAEAIANAAYEVAEVISIPDAWL